MSSSEYPGGVPSKFTPDGTVQPFPGNTIISHLSPEAPLYKAMLSLYTALEKFHLSHLYVLLPPSSWHMTVFEGVCDQVRKKGHWPSDLALDAPLAECTALFERKLKDFRLDCPPPYKMTITGYEPLKIGIGIHVEPATPEENKRLRGLRDRLAEELQIKHKAHAVYGLHLSVAYLLRHLNEDQEAQLRGLLDEHSENLKGEFELGAPEFCEFNNMLAFKRLLNLV